MTKQIQVKRSFSFYVAQICLLELLLDYYDTTDRNSPDDDTIIHREAVSGQASNVPWPDQYRFSQGVDQTEFIRAGDAPVSHVHYPVTDLLL